MYLKNSVFLPVSVTETLYLQDTNGSIAPNESWSPWAKIWAKMTQTRKNTLLFFCIVLVFVLSEFSNLWDSFWFQYKICMVIVLYKDLMQGKLFQRCTHLLSCSVLSLGGTVNTRRISKPDMGSIFHHINNQWNILVIGNYYVNYQNYPNSMPLTSSDTKRTLMHLFLFINSAQR